MFRRNPFSNPSTPVRSISNKETRDTIPEDGTIQIIPSLLAFEPCASTNWNDPPASWTTSTSAVPAVYDVNPEHTTANTSYTYWRRKSSLITNLIAGNGDPYQPKYQTWRVRTPESPRGSLSLHSGIDPAGKEKNRENEWFKRIFVVAVLFVLFFTLHTVGLWYINSILPLSSGAAPHDISLPYFSVPSWKISKLHHLKSKAKGIANELPLRADLGIVFGKPTAFASITSTSTSTSTIHLNSDLLWATPGTVTKATKRSVPTEEAEATKPRSLSSETVLAVPVMAQMGEEDLQEEDQEQESKERLAEHWDGGDQEQVQTSDGGEGAEVDNGGNGSDGGDVPVAMIWEEHSDELPLVQSLDSGDERVSLEEPGASS